MNPVQIATIRKTIEHEGGYVNHPNDKGGCTKYGITLPTLQKHQFSATCEDILNLPIEHAVSIYKLDYAEPFLFIEENPLFSFMFNAAVQHGTKTAVRMLQAAVGVATDGRIGPVTRQAVILAHHENPSGLLARITALRLRYYADILQNPKQLVFARGWLRRIAADLEGTNA